jgi:hypothetical protein
LPRPSATLKLHKFFLGRSFRFVMHFQEDQQIGSRGMVFASSK